MNDRMRGTPTTEQVRAGYVWTASDEGYRNPEEHVPEFDRWLAEHDAALVAEREPRNSMLTDALYKANRERDAAREQLAQAEAVIDRARGWVDPNNAPGFTPENRLAEIDDALSGYPVSSALTERDAAVWNAARLAVARLAVARDLGFSGMNDDIAPCPYRVTPTEEPNP